MVREVSVEKKKTALREQLKDITIYLRHCMSGRSGRRRRRGRGKGTESNQWGIGNMFLNLFQPCKLILGARRRHMRK